MTLPATIHDATRDGRQALRALRYQPGFGAAALLTLALGFGAPTAIFSVVNAVLLRPLPYQDAGRLLRFSIEAQSPRGQVTFDALPVAQALAWSDEAATLDALALFNDTAGTLTTADGPVRLTGIAATPNLFALLGTAPARGRTFDAAARDARQIVLSDAAWRLYFGRDPALVGSSIMLDGQPHIVIGVMPEAFAFPAPDSAFWVPLLLESGSGRGMILPAIGRLASDATVAGAVTEGQRILEDASDAGVEQRLLARTLQDQMVGRYQQVLWVLMAAVSLVSVIATVNIALLLLTRGAGRAREFAIRRALGSSRSRLIRQLVIEGTVLAVLGGLAGVAVGMVSLSALVRIAPPDLPRLSDAHIDLQVLAFTAMLVLIAIVIFGAIAAGRMTSPAGVPRTRLNVLAAAELALAVVLLVGAGLLLRSFVALVLIDQGFEARHAVAAQVTLPGARYPGAAARMAFHERLLERARALPGVQAAGLTTSMPNRQPTGRFAYDPVGVDPFADPFTMKVAEVRMVTPGFLEAMGVPLLAGRTFTQADSEGGEPVMVLSERLARQHFPDSDPVGALLYSGSGNRRVIGVVGDVHPAAQDSQPSPSAYIPLRQEQDVLGWAATVTLVVRDTGTPVDAAALRSMVLSLDPEMPLFNVRTLDREVAGLVAGPRFTATALALFALVALVKAAIGVYGVMAYSAGRRTREIGIRMALGATSSQILRLVARDGVAVVAAGLAAGLLAAIWLARLLTGLLHDVSPSDPIALLLVALVLAATGLAATLIPARRATRVSALVALRHD